jgi:hypothetical protein
MDPDQCFSDCTLQNTSVPQSSVLSIFQIVWDVISYQVRQHSWTVARSRDFSMSQSDPAQYKHTQLSPNQHFLNHCTVEDLCLRTPVFHQMQCWKGWENAFLLLRLSCVRGSHERKALVHEVWIGLDILHF